MLSLFPENIIKSLIKLSKKSSIKISMNKSPHISKLSIKKSQLNSKEPNLFSYQTESNVIIFNSIHMIQSHFFTKKL